MTAHSSILIGSLVYDNQLCDENTDDVYWTVAKGQSLRRKGRNASDMDVQHDDVHLTYCFYYSY